MDSTKLIGVFRGASIRPNLYRPSANGVYNTNDKLINLYNFRTTQPTVADNYMYLTSATPPWNSRRYQFTSGGFNGAPNPYFRDLLGQSFGVPSHNFMYNGVTSNFYQIQKPFILQQAGYLSLDATKLLTGAIYNLTSTAVASENAYTANAMPFANLSAYDSAIQTPYLTNSNAGTLLSNACYNRNYLVAGTLSFNMLTVNTGATFTLYIYLGDDIKSQISVGCISGETNKTMFINTVINATVADVGKLINFKIKFTGSILTLPSFNPLQIYLSYTTL
jgi:hypothetical protein